MGWEQMSLKQLSTHLDFSLVLLPSVPEVLGTAIPQYLEDTVVYIGLILLFLPYLLKIQLSQVF